MRRLAFAFAAFSFILLFGGCGQSGPLYLPGDPSTIQSPTAPADADQEEEKEENSDAPTG